MSCVARSRPCAARPAVTRGKRSCSQAASRWVASRYTWSVPAARISTSMPRTTTSREASSPRGSYLRHEALAGLVAQVRALAAQRLGDEQHGLLPGHGQPGGVELHELQVADGGAGAIRHGDAVAGGHARVGGAPVHLPRAAGGEHGDHGHVEREHAVVEVERQGADALAVHGEQVDHELVLVELDTAAHPSGLGERARDLAAGGVAAGVHHASHRVGALAAQHDLPVDLVEARADVHELAHALRDPRSRARARRPRRRGRRRRSRCPGSAGRGSRWGPGRRRCPPAQGRWWCRRTRPW